MSNDYQFIAGNLYAVTTGTYVGEMYVMVEQNSECCGVLLLPKNTNKQIPNVKIEFGLKHGIIELVQKLPSEIYEVIVAQYNKNKNENINH